MRGFVIYPTYKIVDNKAYVLLFGRLEDGKSFLSVNYYRPYFFVKKTDEEKARQLIKADYEVTNLKSFDGQPMTKVLLDIPKDVPKIRKQLEENDVSCFEADIRFAYRFMMDKGIRSVLDIGESKEPKIEIDSTADQIYHEPDIKGITYYDSERFNIDLKILSIDIETDFRASKIYSISFYSKDLSEVFILGNSKNATCFDEEKSMLEAFVRKIISYDPDIITGWNVVDFDFNVIFRRLKFHKIPLRLGRIDWDSRMIKQTSFLRDSSATLHGRLVMDGLTMLRTSFVKLDDYKLNTVAKEVLGEEKLEIDIENIQKVIKEDVERLVAYNLKDSKLVYDILEKKKIIALSLERSLLTGMPLDRVQASVASLDSMYLREIRKLKYVCPSSGNSEREERIKGGFVRDPISGVHENVLVFDFKSLYPSIMITFNIDPLSYDPSGKKGEIKAPNGARFFDTPSVIPKLIKDLWRNRDEAKKEGNELASWAIKITMNSMYGVIANPSCRFYSTDIANAVTSFARTIVKETAARIEAMGHEVIYGDTDSVFVKVKSDVGIKIRDKINAFYNDMVTKDFGRKSAIELEFEKVYSILILPKQRHGTTGAKKRYAGLIKKDGKEKIDVVGLEIVRRDWTELAKSFQKELLDRVFHKKEIQTYVKGFKEKLFSGEFDNLLVYKKALRKPLEEYTKTTPPHVKAARKLEKVESKIIEYVMTEDGPEPLQKQKSRIDYNHYLEKQVKPIADSILSLYDKSFDEIIEGQSNLFDF